MIVLNNLVKAYGDKLVLKGISYKFSSRGLYFIEGKSGVGKTTLLNIISGLDKAYGGELKVDGSTFYLSSSGNLVSGFKVKENITLNENMNGINKKYFSHLRIEELMNKNINNLSLGETKRVSLYLAMNTNSDIVLLDEPLAGLDDRYKGIVSKILQKESKRRLIIFTGHNLDYKGIESNDDFDKEVTRKRQSNRLKNSFLWGLFLHYKKIVFLLLFVFSLLTVRIGEQRVNEEIAKINDESIVSFKKGNVYYKDKELESIDEEMFYNLVVKNLTGIVDDYYIHKYSSELYDGEVLYKNNHLSNGFTIANSVVDESLNKDEIIIGINKIEYCRNYNYSRCSEDIFELMKGDTLKYKFNDETYIFKIISYYESEQFELVMDSESKSEMLGLLKDDSYYTYLMKLDKEKESMFFNKLKDNEALANFEFTYLKEEDEDIYYLVSLSDSVYFLDSEIEESYIVCTDSGISCTSFSYLDLVSLKMIDDLSVNVKYQKDLSINSYDEIGISSSLASKLKKKAGDKINLEFYIDGNIYNLQNVLIKEVKEDNVDTVYHAKYDYKLYNDKFNLHLRAKEIVSKGELNYSKKGLLYENVLDEFLNYIDDLTKKMNILIVIFIFIAFTCFFFIENKHLKKWKSFFDYLNRSHVSIKTAYLGYMFPYYLCSLFFIDNPIYFSIYLSFCLLFTVFGKNKIQIALD